MACYLQRGDGCLEMLSFVTKFMLISKLVDMDASRLIWVQCTNGELESMLRTLEKKVEESMETSEIFRSEENKFPKVQRPLQGFEELR